VKNRLRELRFLLQRGYAWEWLKLAGIILLAVFMLAILGGCASGPTIYCAGNTNVCVIEREGFHSSVVYLRRCFEPCE